MEFGLVLVENRQDVNSRTILRNHRKYLSDKWDMLWYSIPSVTDAASYNELLTSYTFWISLQRYHRVLICQHDSGLLRKGVEEFLEWSYVGAPWPDNAPWNPGKGGNGGLSLRDPKESLKTIQRVKYDAKYGNEDVYFSRFMDNVAPKEVCERFSVETSFKLSTFGYHAIDKYMSPEQVTMIKSQYE